MRRYETIFIVDAELSDEGREPVFDRLKDLVQQHEGFIAEVDEWGSKRLAYVIKKKSRGYYVRLDYCGTGNLVSEIERFFRIDDRILKYMTVLLDKNVDLDKVKAEVARIAEEKRQAEEAKEAEQKARLEAEKAAKEKAQAAEDAGDAGEEASAATPETAKVEVEDAPDAKAAPEAETETEATDQGDVNAPEPIPSESDTEEK